MAQVSVNVEEKISPEVEDSVDIDKTEAKAKVDAEEGLKDDEEIETSEFRSFLHGFLKVSPQANILNILTLVVITFMSAFFYEFLFDFQTQFLTVVQPNDPETFNKKVEKTDTTLQVVTLILFSFIGYLGDRAGRRIMVAVGFLLQAVALFAIPATENIYYQYSAAYVIFNIGSLLVFAMTVTSIGDYFHPTSVGKVVGVLSFFGILGVHLGGKIYRRDGVENLCIDKSYNLQGGLALIMAVVSFFGLQSEKNRRLFQQKVDERFGFCAASKTSYALLKSNRGYRLACVAALMAIGTSMVTRFFIVGYMQRDFNERNECNHQSLGACFSPFPIPNVTCLVDIRSSECDEQLTDTNAFGCPAGFPIMEELNDDVLPMYAVAASVFLVFSDVVPPMFSVLFSSLFGIVAFDFAFKIENMSDENFKPGNQLWAFSGLLSVLVWINLLLKSLPESNKASAVGVSVALSSVGAMFTHGLGGYLFGTQGLNSPWYVVF